MPTIRIPDPSLVLLIGAAGSGKSTFAARHFRTHEVLSSDALREAISGDSADQRATRPAFAELHARLERRLAAGRLTVVDATNLQTSARRALIRRARAAGVVVTAIVLDLPGDLVQVRNATRSGRQVDATVVDRHLAAVRTLVDDDRLAHEGYASLTILRAAADLDATTIERPITLVRPNRPR